MMIEVCHPLTMSRLLTAEEIAQQLTTLPGWQGTSERLTCRYAFPEFLTAVAAVNAVAAEAEEMNHHPDIDIRWRNITFVASTHSAGGVTQLDIELAHRIRMIAEENAATVL
jgi:4a-hydroxytetrahydrobiopterin dehydratase